MIELLFTDSYTKYIKEVLVITIYKFKKKLILENIVGLYNTSKNNIYEIIKIFKRIIQ